MQKENTFFFCSNYRFLNKTNIRKKLGVQRQGSMNGVVVSYKIPILVTRVRFPVHAFFMDVSAFFGDISRQDSLSYASGSIPS